MWLAPRLSDLILLSFATHHASFGGGVQAVLAINAMLGTHQCSDHVEERAWLMMYGVLVIFP